AGVVEEDVHRAVAGAVAVDGGEAADGGALGGEEGLPFLGEALAVAGEGDVGGGVVVGIDLDDPAARLAHGEVVDPRDEPAGGVGSALEHDRNGLGERRSAGGEGQKCDRPPQREWASTDRHGCVSATASFVRASRASSTRRQKTPRTS